MSLWLFRYLGIVAVRKESYKVGGKEWEKAILHGILIDFERGETWLLLFCSGVFLLLFWNIESTKHLILSIEVNSELVYSIF
jgi:hypothetical protein